MAKQRRGISTEEVWPMIPSDTWFGSTRPSQDHDDGGDGMAIQCSLCGVSKKKKHSNKEKDDDENI